MPLARRAVGYAAFLWDRHVVGLTIHDAPKFEPAGLQLFAERLARAGSHAEFGSGGSTLLAAARGIPFVSVDSDAPFLDAVRQRVQALGRFDAAAQTYLRADIGRTEAWGRPVLRSPTPRRQARWRRYPEAPWRALAGLPQPHLILIDGRFRVACALRAARFLAGREGEILFDDYFDRAEYHVVEQHLELRQRAGRMALFGAGADVDAAALDAAIEAHCADWR